MFHFEATKEQTSSLEALAYWVADESYIRERFGTKDPEIEICKRTISECVFPECDRLKIPYWVQNCVICFAENWRAYQSFYLKNAMESKGIVL